MRYLFSMLFVVSAVILLYTPLYSSDEVLISSIKADYVLVDKSSRQMFLYKGDRVLRTYRIALGRDPVGPKVREGDNKTPEGLYFIDARNPESEYHLSLHISYPDRVDVMRAERQGVSPGGGIMIHGTGEDYAWMGKFHTAGDWTEGCIAVTNEEMEEVWNLVPDGTMIEIRP